MANRAFAACVSPSGRLWVSLPLAIRRRRFSSAYPYLEEEDIRQALGYAAWRVEEIELPLPVA